MGALEVAARHARQQVALARRAALEVARLWARVDRQQIRRSWAASVPAAVQVLGSAQAIAAASSGAYLDDLLDEYGLDVAVEGRIRPEGFAGVASDGRDLPGLLYQPAVTALTALKGGASEARAVAAGRFALDTIMRSQVADAGRVADGVALAVRPQLTGYVRMVVGGTCARCLILAGRVYRWNAGFLRHPRCDCRHIPATEDVAGDLRTDPKAAFEAMPAAEQERVFGLAGAEAIRDGADMARVVNARRGMQVVGRRRFTTAAAGRRLRLMPEQIYADARDRDDAIRLLRLHGYIT
ncbi:hypothetical protein ACQSSU_06655 [Micromonospora echinospora]